MEIFIYYGTALEEPKLRIENIEAGEFIAEESHNGVQEIVVHAHGDDCNAYIQTRGHDCEAANLAWYAAKKMYLANQGELWTR